MRCDSIIATFLSTIATSLSTNATPMSTPANATFLFVIATSMSATAMLMFMTMFPVPDLSNLSRSSESSNSCDQERRSRAHTRGFCEHRADNVEIDSGVCLRSTTTL